MPKEQGFIKYIIIIIVILLVVFLSQQAYSREAGKGLISAATNQAQAYLSKGSNWVMSNVYPKIGGEVQKREDQIKTETDQTKKNVSENVGKKIKNYFSGVANSILGKSNNNCQTGPSK